MNLSRSPASCAARLAALFLPDAGAAAPLPRRRAALRRTTPLEGLVLFYEYFHGDDGRGLGASHQTGWTALVSLILERSGRQKS